MKVRRRPTILVFLFVFLCLSTSFSQSPPHSVARQWNEALLHSIRNDFARPTVHARNLFHISMAAYDSWAVYSGKANTVFLGKTLGNYTSNYTPVAIPSNPLVAQNAAISYASYRLIVNRFSTSPNYTSQILPYINNLMAQLGYNPSNISTAYQTGGGAELGNYIASEIIAFGLQDGSNQQNGYANLYYQPVNGFIAPTAEGNRYMYNPNRWQPIQLSVFIDQNGFPFPMGQTPPFLSAEWGRVTPFSLQPTDRTTYFRSGNPYHCYHDPGAPAQMTTPNGGGDTDEFRWNHLLVAIWSSHLDTVDNVMWDISPANIGKSAPYPTNFTEYQQFYDLYNGGTLDSGYVVNPKTGLPYTPQIIRRGDFARVLSEFWADGPSSETPPGHWFSILNYVSDHPQFIKRWEGRGPILDDLEWDVRSYLTLGGAMHDAAVTCWGNKGWYDSARPISALRYMASKGQCTDLMASDYSPLGLPLIPGFVERVMVGDPLADSIMVSGTTVVVTPNGNVGKLKIKAWLGPDSISNPATDMAGVGWILASKWWPYQRPTFVTPPFAGFFSGHSTFSAAAAEIMKNMTGDEFFPGGMGVFAAPMNQYLQFEEGPSQNIELQWATYRDAADQCSLSRIWGGIHPPMDDIPGRIAGNKIGQDAFQYAEQYMDADGKPSITSFLATPSSINPSHLGQLGAFSVRVEYEKAMDTTSAPIVFFPNHNLTNSLAFNSDSSLWLNDYTYLARFDVLLTSNERITDIDVAVASAKDFYNITQDTFVADSVFEINTKLPSVVSITSSSNLVNDALVGMSAFWIEIAFDEKMDTLRTPKIVFPIENPSTSLIFNASVSRWASDSVFRAFYDVIDMSIALDSIDVMVDSVKSAFSNWMKPSTSPDLFSIHTENPSVAGVMFSPQVINDTHIGLANFNMEIQFSSDMDVLALPVITFPVENPSAAIGFNPDSSQWVSPSRYMARFDVQDANTDIRNIDITVSGTTNIYDNTQLAYTNVNQFDIEMRNPLIQNVASNINLINDAAVNSGSQLFVNVIFDEIMDGSSTPIINFPNVNVAQTLLFLSASWTSPNIYRFVYALQDANISQLDIDINIQGGRDVTQNTAAALTHQSVIDIDTENPLLISAIPSMAVVRNQHIGMGGFSVDIAFSEKMRQSIDPTLLFPVENPLATALSHNTGASLWTSDSTYRVVFDVLYHPDTLREIDVRCILAEDFHQNEMVAFTQANLFDLEIRDTTLSVLGNEQYLISVFPNPARIGESMVFDFRKDGSRSLEVFNAAGSLLLREDIEGERYLLGTLSFSSGVYFYKLQDSEGIYNGKL